MLLGAIFILINIVAAYQKCGTDMFQPLKKNSQVYERGVP